ncbi:ABC transporter ATP-binding protein [Acidaminobacter hydrogenoformans]|uniref:ATP-binding cassette, subfamily B n=1 Tax=Acidaminobacter hydrogenoformans DSM 2784 TaxID=1120920 RepID=A0A1G5RW29_9FIRM|nr:ABC transporter ATP-binding protein [Acidaminobacter hydrogenoformans]SCZ78324.1 ATP-binding cassette, subfamily B [Acidaminobacter hydrogenoformans DSM 2784]
METIISEETKRKKIDRGLWLRLLPYMKNFKKELTVVVICLAILGAMDVLMTYLTKHLIDAYITPKELEGLSRFIAAYAGIVLVIALVVYKFIQTAGVIEAGLSHDIRKAGFEKLQQLSMSYFDKNAAGWILARLTSDVTKLGEFISWGLVDMVWGMTMMLGIMAVMLAVNFKLALITLSVMPALVLVSWYFQSRIVALQRVVRKLNSRITGAINEGITGARTTKTLVVEEKVMNDFRVLSGNMRDQSIKSAFYSALYQPMVINIAAVGTVLAIQFGGREVMSGAITYGTLVLFINYSIQFFEPVREMARILSEMQSAQVSAERIFMLLDQKTEIEDSEAVKARYGTILSPKREAYEAMKGDIEFRSVYFSYKPEEPIFEGLTLEIEAGTSVALVGPTGSGKSSLVNLICRFYEPTAGEILLDGTPLKARSQSWLHNGIGYVLQTPHLFSGTISDNIRYGRLDATQEEIQKAAVLVGADTFISQLSDGYDTQVGEGGAMLSTGQKQLISFARAVIAEPSIFILDEATSAIDTEAEQLIQNALIKVLENRTSLIIAHRLSTIRACDRILVIEDGHIIEDGTHHSLMKLKGHYWKLYTNQFIEEKEQALLA